MESAEVTLQRTAAATALAARSLARPNSRTVAIVGCGEQAGAQLAALLEVLPLERCLAFDRDAGRAQALAARSHGIECVAVPALGDATVEGVTDGIGDDDRAGEAGPPTPESDGRPRNAMPATATTTTAATASNGLRYEFTWESLLRNRHTRRCG